MNHTGHMQQHTQPCTGVCVLGAIILVASRPGWLGSRVVIVLDSGPGSNRSRDAVG